MKKRLPAILHVTLALLLLLAVPISPLARTIPTDTTPTTSSVRVAARGMEAFLYIEDFELRFEILAPLSLVQSFIPIDGDESELFTVEEQTAARDPVISYFSMNNEMEIDGLPVMPVRSRVSFFDQAIQSITAEQTREDLDPSRALLGLVYTYSTKGPPQRMRFQWGDFNEVVPLVRIAVFTRDKESRETLTPANPSISWTSPGRAAQSPLVAVPAEDGRVCNPSEQDAREIFEALHRNLYRAFDYRDEEQIYDALALSVSGDLLAKLYLQIRHGLEVQNEGGAAAKVDEVKVIKSRLVGDGVTAMGFDYTAEWTVRGRVEHWGHVHDRINLYVANFSITPSEDSWKISDVTFLRQERLESALTVRSASSDSSTLKDAVSQ